MFRSTAIFTLKSCRHLTLTTRSSFKFKPLLQNGYSSSYVLLARAESTGMGTIPDKEILSSSSKVLESKIPEAPNVAEAVAQPELVFTPVGTAVDGIASIPDAPVPVPTVIEEAIVTLAANGEPTLHSLGLGSMYPSGLVQQALELMHCNLGMPWWAAIAAGTVIIRMLLFPLVIKSQRMSAKMHNVMPQMQALQQKMTDARNTGNQLMAAKYGNDMVVFMKEKDLNPLKQMMVPLAMAPIFVSCFFGLRAMANLPVESMKTGGMLWFTDLTVCDPYYILPLITSTTLWLTLETGADSARLSSSPNSHLMKYVFRAIPLVVFPFTMNFPAALLCYWCSTNAVSLLQVTFLKIPKVREALNIEQLKNHQPDALPKKNKGFIKDAKEAWTNMKISKQLEERERFDEQMYKRAGRAPIPKTYKYDPTKLQALQAKQK